MNRQEQRLLLVLSVLATTLAPAATTYEYDAQQRLTSVTFDNGARIAYEYNAGSNRVHRTYVPPVPGDLDGDRDVDMADFNLFAGALAGPGVTTPPPGYESKHFTRADLDHDGDVDLADFAEFQKVFNGGG